MVYLVVFMDCSGSHLCAGVISVGNFHSLSQKSEAATHHSTGRRCKKGLKAQECFEWFWNPKTNVSKFSEARVKFKKFKV